MTPSPRAPGCREQAAHEPVDPQQARRGGRRQDRDHHQRPADFGREQVHRGKRAQRAQHDDGGDAEQAIDGHRRDGFVPARRVPRQLPRAGCIAADARGQETADERADEEDARGGRGRDGGSGRAQQQDPAPDHHQAIEGDEHRHAGERRQIDPRNGAQRVGQVDASREPGENRQRDAEPEPQRARDRRDHDRTGLATNVSVSNRFLRILNRSSVGAGVARQRIDARHVDEQRDGREQVAPDAGRHADAADGARDLEARRRRAAGARGARS